MLPDLRVTDTQIEAFNFRCRQPFSPQPVSQLGSCHNTAVAAAIHNPQPTTCDPRPTTYDPRLPILGPGEAVTTRIAADQKVNKPLVRAAALCIISFCRAKLRIRANVANF